MAAAVPYIVMAAATAAGAYNQRQIANRQDRAAAQGIRMQAQRQEQANQQVNQLLDKTARSNPDAAAADSRAQFMQQLAAARGNAQQSFGPAGAASSRYTADVGRAQDASNAYATDLASTLSRIDAPAQQRRIEAQDLGRAGSQIGLIGDAAKGDDFLTALKARSVQGNPWLDAASQLGMAYAAGSAGRRTPRQNASTMLDGAISARPDIF